jgi:pimeloyl-ACP methyl ester carboxylesterase
MLCSYYKSLYKISPSPVADITEYCAALGANLSQPSRLAALRGQVFAVKQPCAVKIPVFVAANIPWTVVYGSKDPDFPSVPVESEEFLRRFAAASPFAPVPGVAANPDKLLLVEGAGHYPHVEAPAAVAAHITKFLASIKR